MGLTKTYIDAEPISNELRLEKQRLDALAKIQNGDFSAASDDSPDDSDIVILSSDNNSPVPIAELEKVKEKEIQQVKEKEIQQVKAHDSNYSSIPITYPSLDLEKCIASTIRKEFSKFDIKPKLENATEPYEAELGINVLKYKFYYSDVYAFEQMIIFVLADNSFSLTLDQPVEFSLSYAGKDIPNIICIGKPLQLSRLNTSLLIFVKK